MIVSVSLCGYVLPCMAGNTVKIIVVVKPGMTTTFIDQHLPRGVISSRRIPGSSMLLMNVSQDRVAQVIIELKKYKDVLSVELSTDGRIENSFGGEEPVIPAINQGKSQRINQVKNPMAAGINQKTAGVEDFSVIKLNNDDIKWYKDIDGKKIAELSSGQGVVVAVIDTGIDFSNELFSPDIFVNKGEIAGDAIDNDGNGYVDDINGINIGDDNNNPQDENGHGTEIASVILTVSPHCQLLPIKVNQDGSDTFSTADLVEGIYYAISTGADVINLSLTADQDSQAVAVAVRAAHDAGIIVVAAAGNDAGSVEFPASMDEVVAVGGLNNDLQAWFSPQGPEMEITAPAVAIDAISLGGSEVNVSGTSFSCAMISGTAADIAGMNPHLKNETIRNILDSGTRDLGDTGRDDIYGDGGLDGGILFDAASPRLILPFKPFYAFSREAPISISFHLPPTDTAFNVYIGVFSPDNKFWWLDKYGNWHDSEVSLISPIAEFENNSSDSQFLDGVLFGTDGTFDAFNPVKLDSGVYKWGIAITDANTGELFGPVTWNYMLIF